MNLQTCHLLRKITFKRPAKYTITKNCNQTYKEEEISVKQHFQQYYNPMEINGIVPFFRGGKTVLYPFVKPSTKKKEKAIKIK